MQSFEEILELVRALPPEERRQLIEELDALGEQDSLPGGDGPYSGLLALAGTIHSDHIDLSTNKYEHVGAAIAEHKTE